jgi:thiol-disulfide isomerase/thioredoxin
MPYFFNLAKCLFNIINSTFLTMKCILIFICILGNVYISFAQKVFYYNKAFGFQPISIMDSVIKKLNVSASKHFPWVTKAVQKKDSVIYYWQNKQQDRTLDKAAQESITKALYTNNFTDVNGKLIKGASLKNKVVVINYWADYCIPCIKEIGVLTAIRNYFVKDTNIIFLAPCFDVQGQCKAITNKFDFTYHVLNKKGNSIITKPAGIYRFPTTIIVNGLGVITHYYFAASATIPGVKPTDEPLYLTLTNTLTYMRK